MHARFWRSLPGCFSMSFHEIPRGTLVPHDALPLLGTSLDAQRLGLKDWKIAAPKIDSNMTAVILRQPAGHQEASQPAASEDFWLYTYFLLAKHVCLWEQIYIMFFFFRWKLLIVTHCLIERSLKDHWKYFVWIWISLPWISPNSFPYQVYLVRMWKTCLRWWCSTWMEPFGSAEHPLL